MDKIETAEQPEPTERQKIDAEIREQFRDGTLGKKREIPEDWFV